MCHCRQCLRHEPVFLVRASLERKWRVHKNPSDRFISLGGSLVKIRCSRMAADRTLREIGTEAVAFDYVVLAITPENHVYDCQRSDGGFLFNPKDIVLLKSLPLRIGTAAAYVIEGGDKETAGPARRIQHNVVTGNTNSFHGEPSNVPGRQDDSNLLSAVAVFQKHLVKLTEYVRTGIH